jgi:hypothetical protein
MGPPTARAVELPADVDDAAIDDDVDDDDGGWKGGCCVLCIFVLCCAFATSRTAAPPVTDLSLTGELFEVRAASQGRVDALWPPRHPMIDRQL